MALSIIIFVSLSIQESSPATILWSLKVILRGLLISVVKSMNFYDFIVTAIQTA